MKSPRFAPGGGRALVAAAFFLLAAGGVPDAVAGEPRRFVPDPASAPGVLLDGELWTAETEGATIHFGRLDTAQRRRFLRNRAGIESDPFSTRPDSAGGFLTFLLDVENTGEGELVLQPQKCWLETNAQEIAFPLDMASLRSTYHILERPVPRPLERAGAALLDHEVRLPPGERVNGLLVYRKVSPKTKWYRVDVEVTLPNGERTGFRARYRRETRRERTLRRNGEKTKR